ncbi:MAG: hypothetical protein K8T26_01535 [Lentisphaerae bacterium]|nr:hypothetical protein [Lentisphaerota bacterium]
MKRTCASLFVLLITCAGSFAAELTAEPPELTQARRMFEQASNSALLPIQRKYASDLDALQKRLATKGELEAALAVKEERERILETMESTSAHTKLSTGMERRGQPISIMATATCPNGKQTPDGLAFQEGSPLISAKDFKPPVKITYLVKTDSTNIRLGYAAQEIIFNWEHKPNELRIGGGPANGQHRAGKGGVPVNQFVRIEQDVQPDKMTISVDGEERATWSADFSNVKQPIRVFTAKNATVTVKDILVE